MGDMGDMSLRPGGLLNTSIVELIEKVFGD